MRSIRPLLTRLFRLTNAVALAACTTATDPEPIATISLLPNTDSLEIGETFGGWLVTLRDAGGVVLASRPLTWQSSNLTAATVDASTGVVTGVGTGESVISVRAEGKEALATVKVVAPIVAIIATPDSFDLPLTTTRTIGAQVVGPNGVAITTRVITWSSANPGVAVVSGSGLVTAVSVGTTTITLRAGTKQTTVRVRVIGEPVTSVRITPQQTVQVVRLGQTKQLGAECLNASLQVLVGRPITWNSSNPLVATVSGAGLVSGAAVGSATITATCDGTVSASVTAQVTLIPVTSVGISPNGLSLTQGTQGQLTVTARDSANNVLSLQGRQVTWSSNNIPVAQVSTQGVVSGVSIGVAQITVSVDNVVSAPVTVDVRAMFSMLNELAYGPAPRSVTLPNQRR